MASGVWPLVGWLIFAAILTTLLCIVAWRILVGRRKPGYLAVVEYWVYSNAQRIPPTEALMDGVVAKNPFNRPGRPCITAREGILFSDIRLHLGIAKREKNPNAFRPDLFDVNAVPTAEVLERLADCSSIAKVKYASQVPLIDGRHLQFMTHLTATTARLLRSKVVFDTVAERFWLIEELEEELTRISNAERPDLHVRVVWEKTVEGCVAKTLGLLKMGHAELWTEPQEPDMEVLVVDILQHAAMRLFAKTDATLPIEYKTHGDTFIVSDMGMELGHRKVKVARRMSS